ncbi:MAG: hypothetical protein AB1391_01290 [Candidatus Micrarchaeota archaeon]
MISIPNIYKNDYKKLIIFPLVLLIAAIYFAQYIKLGVDFTGGTLIILNLEKSVNAEELKTNLEKDGMHGTVKVYSTSFGEHAEIELSQNPDLIKADHLKNEFNSKLEEVALLESKSNTNSSFLEEYRQKRRILNNISNALLALAKKEQNADGIENLNTLNTETLNAYRTIYDDYKNSISKILDKYTEYSSFSVQSISPALSTHFIENAIRVAIFSSIFCIIFVFIFFRIFVPSLAIIIGALSDVIIALGAMGFFGIPFTLASFAALLMILGFSLDTDILLTMRILKRTGDPREKAFDAMKTGATMSLTAIFSFFILYIIGTYTHISIYYEISAVALAGLVGDLFATWGINAVILLHYVEGKYGS